jgi:hypothetical protein
MVNESESSKSVDKEILTVPLPTALMRKIETFCVSNDIRIEQFAIDAFLEKLDRWKE